MKKRVYNPYLPLDEYVPDGEPHLFQGRLYIFGSHDQENGNNFCTLDYVAWSAPEDDLSDWRCEGVIYTKDQDPANVDGAKSMYAPDVVCGNDGRYYLFYCLAMEPVFSVAVCDTPAGHYQFLGYVRNADGTVFRDNAPYDPAVINDSGRIYLYYGFSPTFPITFGDFPKDCPGCSVVELESDMLTVKTRPVVVLPAKQHAADSCFEEHAFFEAASIRKFGDTYYLVYASELLHELCYATSTQPCEGFTFAGTIISNGDVGLNGRAESDCVAPAGNIHGGLVEVRGQYFIFYHRHTHGTMFSRQGCAECVNMDANGRIAQVEVTSCGLSETPFETSGIYPAVIACNLLGKAGAKAPVYGKVTQGVPMVSSAGGERFVAQIEDGAVIGYKYFDFQGGFSLTVTVRGNAEGVLEISDTADGDTLGTITVTPSESWSVTGTQMELTGKSGLFLRYKGEGCAQLLNLGFDL